MSTALRTVGPQTSLYAIFGSPIRHAMSPVIQNSAFARHGLDAVMIALEADTESFEELFTPLKKAANFKGFVFTMPVKTLAMRFMDDVSPEAAIIGATNCAARGAGGRLTAYNTDSIGFWTSVRTRCRAEETIDSAFIMGAGGMARAAIAQLALQGVSRITVANRAEDKSFIADLEAFGERLRRHCPSISLELTGWEPSEWSRFTCEAKLIANCSANGMNGKGDLDSTFPFSSVRDDAIFCEAVYEPLETPFIIKAGELGHRTVHGIELLTHQGANAFFKWTGIHADPELMQSDIENYRASIGRS